MTLFDELKAERTEPTNILFGTDWWTDCDDVAALALLLKAHKAGLVKLLGIGIDSVMAYSAASVDALCEESGLSIPIGVADAVRKSPFCLYQKALAKAGRRGLKNEDCPDACRLYRQTLAGLDGKAVIVEVGFPQIVMELLQSPPDDVSPLAGVDLVREKVKEIRLMAGKWDEEDGKEYNLSAYPVCAEAGDCLCRTAPVPLIFLGYEVGAKVIGGRRLNKKSLLYKAYKLHGHPHGRSSWDPMTALAAIVGDDERAGYRRVTGTAAVDPQTGRNRFTPSPDGPHAYLVKTRPDEAYADELDELLSD